MTIEDRLRAAGALQDIRIAAARYKASPACMFSVDWISHAVAAMELMQRNQAEESASEDERRRFKHQWGIV